MYRRKLIREYRGVFPPFAILCLILIIVSEIWNVADYADLWTDRNFIFAIVGLFFLSLYFWTNPLELDPSDPSDRMRIEIGQAFGYKFNENSDGSMTPVGWAEEDRESR